MSCMKVSLACSTELPALATQSTDSQPCWQEQKVRSWTFSFFWVSKPMKVEDIFISRLDERPIEISLHQQHPLPWGVFRLWYWVCNWMDKKSCSVKVLSCTSVWICVHSDLDIWDYPNEMHIGEARQHYKIEAPCSSNYYHMNFKISQDISLQTFRRRGHYNILLWHKGEEQGHGTASHSLVTQFSPSIVSLRLPSYKHHLLLLTHNSTSCWFSEGTVLSSHL